MLNMVKKKDSKKDNKKEVVHLDLKVSSAPDLKRLISPQDFLNAHHLKTILPSKPEVLKKLKMKENFTTSGTSNYFQETKDPSGNVHFLLI